MRNYENLEFRGIQYRIYYPVNYRKDQKYPVFYHLHGSGSRGRDFEHFDDSSSLLRLINAGGSPFDDLLCVFPQCSDDTWYDHFNDLLDLTREVYNRPDVDQNRFNGSGISMGGYGIYQVMMCLPELFHKAIVCCGGGMYWNAGRMKNIHFRIFHGAKDTAVFPEEAERMFHNLKEVGADVTLTIYPECYHDCWTKTYTNHENLAWLLTL